MLSNIKKRIIQDSRKELFRLNILLTCLVLLCSLFFLLLYENRWVTIVMATKSGAYIFIISSIQSFILRYCTLKFSDNPTLLKVMRYTLSYSIGISLYLFFWYVFASLAGILERPNDTEWFIKYAVVAAIINTIILFLHDFVILRRLKIQTDLENSHLQTRNVEAENLLLKQQIQPHFLFNALNTLKVLYENDTKKGEQYLIQLADFLRVAVSHHHKFSATLEEELIMCKNYLNMQKIRFAESLEWDLRIENSEKLKGYVPSFSLQPLLENAIKHNGFTRQQPLKITIRQYDDVIEVSNSINPKEYGDISIKSGLSNLAERYYLLTGEEISVKNDGLIFSVGFKIMDNESSNY